MKVTGGKPFRMDLGIWFLAIAALCAVFVLPGARNARSPILFLFIFGGLSVGIPATLGVAIIRENIRSRHRNKKQY